MNARLDCNCRGVSESTHGAGINPTHCKPPNTDGQLEGMAYFFLGFGSGNEKRYLVLDRGCLSIYRGKQQPPATPHRLLHVSQLQVRKGAEDNVLILTYNGSEHVVQLKNMAVRQQWLVAFAQAQAKYPAELSPASSEEEALDIIATLSAGSSNFDLDGQASGVNAVSRSALSLGQMSIRSARSVDSPHLPAVPLILTDHMSTIIQRRTSVLMAMDTIEEDYKRQHLEGNTDAHKVGDHTSDLHVQVQRMRESLHSFTDLLRQHHALLENRLARQRHRRKEAERKLEQLLKQNEEMEVSANQRKKSQARPRGEAGLSPQTALRPMRQGSSKAGDDSSDEEFFDFGDYTPEQLEAIKVGEAIMELKAHKLVKPIIAAEHTNDVLARFLRARDFSINAAAQMFLEYVKWVQEFQPQKTTPDQLAAELGRGMMYFHKHDKHDRPLIVLHIARMPQQITPADFDKYTRMIILFVETACEATPPHISTFSLLIDFSGFDMANNDMQLTKETFKLLSAYYPERLGTCLLAETPWMFSAVWYALKAFLSPRTAAKVKFVTKKQLAEYVAPNCLVASLGGTSQFNYLQNRTKFPLGLFSDKHSDRLQRKSTRMSESISAAGEGAIPTPDHTST